MEEEKYESDSLNQPMDDGDLLFNQAPDLNDFAVQNDSDMINFEDESSPDKPYVDNSKFGNLGASR